MLSLTPQIHLLNFETTWYRPLAATRKWTTLEPLGNCLQLKVDSTNVPKTIKFELRGGCCYWFDVDSVQAIFCFFKFFILWGHLNLANSSDLRNLSLARCHGLVLRQKTHEWEVMSSTPAVKTTFHVPFIWIKTMKAKNWGKTTWHCCMCCNPANGRVEFLDDWLLYYKWNESLAADQEKNLKKPK